MTKQHDYQTFFLPNRFSEKHSTLPSTHYNLAHTLLNRTKSEYIFIPIRSMQYLAIIDGNDFWFVDSQAYAVSNEEGGRMITVSWHPDPGLEKESLDQHHPMKVVFYERDMSDIQIRLCGEFYQAMQLVDQRYRDEQIPVEGARILPLK